MTQKKPMGRPPKYTGIDCLTVQKVLEGLRMDFTVTEACCYAGISRQTFYAWQAKYPDFSDEIDVSQVYLSTVAKKCLATALLEKGNFDMAMKYLERRFPGSYGKKRESTDAQPITPNLIVNLPAGMEGF